MTPIQPSSRVVCIRNLLWRDVTNAVIFGGPAHGSISLVQAIDSRPGGTPALYLSGYAGWWDACEFVSLTPACDRADAKKDEKGA